MAQNAAGHDVAAARRADVALAKENGLTVIRADVAGRTAGRVSYGSSGIVAPNGTVLSAARPLIEDLVVAELDVASRERDRAGGRSR